MARGTQHRKRRPRDNARGGVVAATAATTAKHKKPKPPQWQEELFFTRLRVHAKWVFLLLAICFAFGFVIFGVGSGSTGISDALQSALNFGSSGTSIGSLQKQVAKHPEDAKAWRNLATAYETKQRTSDAIDALERFTALQPKNADALGELASEYTQLDGTYYTNYQNALAASSVAAPSSQFQLSTTTPFGKAFGSSKSTSPIDTAVLTQASAEVQALASTLTTEENLTVSTYQRLAKLEPTSATTQLQLGQAAESAGNNTVAIAAFKKFLKLSPDDLQAPSVKKALKALQSAKG